MVRSWTINGYTVKPAEGGWAVADGADKQVATFNTIAEAILWITSQSN